MIEKKFGTEPTKVGLFNHIKKIQIQNYFIIYFYWEFIMWVIDTMKMKGFG